MSELPNGWARASVGDLCSLQNGRAFKPTDWTSSGQPIVRIQNLNDPRASFNYYDKPIEDRFQLHGGELLFAWSGTPGTSFGAHIWKGGRAVLNQHIFRVDFDETTIDKRYLQHAINQELQELIRVAHGGVGLRHVTKGVFEATQIALPPENEQRRIADKIDALMSSVESCRQRLGQAQDLFRRLRQAILDAAIGGDLTKDWRATNPGHVIWHECSIDTIAEVGTGSTPLRSNSAFFAPSGTPWITSAATSRPYVVSSSEYVTDAAIQAHRLKVYPKGTLIIAMYGEGKTRGQVTELAIDATINQACAAVQIDVRKAMPEFVKLVFQANYFRFRELAEGGNQPNLNLSKIKAFGFRLPPLDEQDEIVRRISATDARMDALETRVAIALNTLENVTRAVMAKAFRGELVPQNRSDEPATELLERIRNLRVEALGSSQTKKRSRIQESANESAGQVDRSSIHSHQLEAIGLDTIDHISEGSGREVLSRSIDQLDYLASILRRRGPMSPTALWRESLLDIETFYDQLKDEERAGFLRELRQGPFQETRLLEAI